MGDEASLSALITIGRSTQLVHDERGDAYAVIDCDGRRQVLRIRSRLFRRFVSWRYYRRTGDVISSPVLSKAIEVLEAHALFEGPKVRLHNRFASTPDAIWIDLCDEFGRALKVTRDGWSVISQPPVFFRRFDHQAALCLPERGGDVRAVCRFLNVADEQDRLLVLTWLAVAPLSHVPRPMLCADRQAARRRPSSACCGASSTRHISSRWT